MKENWPNAWRNFRDGGGIYDKEAESVCSLNRRAMYATCNRRQGEEDYWELKGVFWYSSEPRHRGCISWTTLTYGHWLWFEVNFFCHVRISWTWQSCDYEDQNFTVAPWPVRFPIKSRTQQRARNYDMNEECIFLRRSRIWNEGFNSFVLNLLFLMHYAWRNHTPISYPMHTWLEK